MRTINPAIRQQEFNRATRGNWNAFAEHRAQIAALLEQSVAPDAKESLCILGAGNCNDLDLPQLASQWKRIRLVDLDAEAMQSGVARQFHMRPPPPPQLELSTCDVTGALEYFHELIHSPLSKEKSLPKLRQALTVLPAVERLNERFSCVASTCLLSQLTDIVRHAVGESSPELLGVIQMVRLQHLRTLAELTAPGGTILVFVDFVSTESLPQLTEVPASALPALMRQALSESNFFTGMNPVVIRQTLNQPPLDAYWSKAPHTTAPWRWNLGPRTYLVTAIVGRRV